MEFLEVPVFDDDVFKLLVRLFADLLVVSVVVLGCYRRQEKNDGYIFTFIILNIMVFFICFALKKLELELGLALGLFAIFGIIRYRTESIGVHEMTYLFVVVGIAVINALSNKKTSYVELAVTNGVIILSTCVLERVYSSRSRASKNGNGKAANGKAANGKSGNGKAANALDLGMNKQSIVYDNLTLLDPAKRDELIRDIQQRTGLVAERIEVSKIDLLKGAANLNVYHKVARQQYGLQN